MSERENVQLVQQVYEAFGRGDIAAIVARLCDDVEWETPFARDAVPIGGRWRGHEEVVQFYAKIGENLEFLQFEPREFIAQGDRVVVLGFSRIRVKPTGRTLESEWVMVWGLREGKVAKFREYADTAAALVAFGCD
jgi:ketosteroid isomerase-like protein